MSFKKHIFVALFICFRTAFVCLSNDFTEVYSYLWVTMDEWYCRFCIQGIPSKGNPYPCKASVTIMADFSPEFDPPVRWRSKHQTKNDG